jgi:hypothetical protein
MHDGKTKGSKSNEQLELDENGLENQKLMLLIERYLIFFMI